MNYTLWVRQAYAVQSVARLKSASPELTFKSITSFSKMMSWLLVQARGWNSSRVVSSAGVFPGPWMKETFWKTCEGLRHLFLSQIQGLLYLNSLTNQSLKHPCAILLKHWSHVQHRKLKEEDFALQFMPSCVTLSHSISTSMPVHKILQTQTLTPVFALAGYAFSDVCTTCKEPDC